MSFIRRIHSTLLKYSGGIVTYARHARPASDIKYTNVIRPQIRQQLQLHQHPHLIRLKPPTPGYNPDMGITNAIGPTGWVSKCDELRRIDLSLFET